MSICLNTTVIWSIGTTPSLAFIQAVLHAQSFALLDGNAFFQQILSISIFDPNFLASPWVCHENGTCFNALAHSGIINQTVDEAPSASTFVGQVAHSDGCGIG